MFPPDEDHSGHTSTERTLARTDQQDGGGVRATSLADVITNLTGWIRYGHPRPATAFFWQSRLQPNPRREVGDMFWFDRRK